MVTGFWQVFELLGHLGFATVLTVWPNDFGRHPRLIRAIGGSVEKVGVRALAAPVSDIRNQLIS